MDTMEYSYYTASTSQPFQYMGYDSNSGLFQQDSGAFQASVEPHSFDPGSFDYTYRTAVPRTGLSFPPTSASPSSPQQSRRPNEPLSSAYNVDMEDRLGRRSSSEEKDNLSPAQSRRKAQNRAAQRAFRERKERHVRDLEAKLDLLTGTTSSLQSENERLKLMLRRAQSENELLRSKASSSPSRRQPAIRSDNPGLLQPQHQSRAAPVQNGLWLSNASVPPGQNSPENTSGNKENSLNATGVWDILQLHPLYLSGTLDVGKVCERLKNKARCDGTGPVFDQAEVCAMIEEVGRSGGGARC